MRMLRNRLGARAVQDDGIAMVITIIIMVVLLGIGAALLATANGQQRSSYNQQTSESAFSLAEAALNAQIYQLSLQWPTSLNAPSGGYPSSCNAASNGSSYCATPSDLSTSYSPGSTQACPAGTPGDAWSSSSTVNNGWTTYVRDAGPSGSSAQQFFDSTSEKSTYAYDYGNTATQGGTPNGFVWVRAVGTVNCHTAVVVSKVSEQIVPLNFPQQALNANDFAIENSGSHNGNGSGSNYILQDQTNGQTSTIGLRCTGVGGNPTSPSSLCANVPNSSQIGPTSPTYTAGATPVLSPSQLQALEEFASTKGTNYGSSCPSNLSGTVVYVAGPCNLTCTSCTINSPNSPGILIIDNGTLDLGGGTTFYGAIYVLNAQNCSPGGAASSSCFSYSGNNSFVVQLEGTTSIVGGIDVDGTGGVLLGQSGQGNLVFGPQELVNLETFGGADATPNTFRQLPVTQ